MGSSAKPRTPRLFLAGIVGLALLLLLLRLFVFAHGYGAHGYGRRRFRGSAPGGKPSLRQASFAAPPVSVAPELTDRFADGTPDFLRLTDPADRAAFRQWFTAIADFQAVRPRADLPTEITDCASLLRYSYREALKRHDDTWFAATGTEIPALPGEIRAWRYPNTPLGANLYRVRPGPFTPADLTNGAFAQFADAKTLIDRNAYLITRDVRLAQPGDLLFYRQFGQSAPWHSMIVTRIGGKLAAVYNTGPDHAPPQQRRNASNPDHGQPGEMRRVTLTELLDHPEPQWRPVPSNPNFLGVYRWNILRGAL
jgi:uncharacterized protein YfaT (DUF1175 family)